jgi:hypothetical protein
MGIEAVQSSSGAASASPSRKIESDTTELQSSPGVPDPGSRAGEEQAAVVQLSSNSAGGAATLESGAGREPEASAAGNDSLAPDVARAADSPPSESAAPERRQPAQNNGEQPATIDVTA